MQASLSEVRPYLPVNALYKPLYLATVTGITMLTTLIYRSQVDPALPLVDLDALILHASAKNLPLGITVMPIS